MKKENDPRNVKVVAQVARRIRKKNGEDVPLKTEERKQLQRETAEGRKRRLEVWKEPQALMCPDLQFVYHDGKIDIYPVFRVQSVSLI